MNYIYESPATISRSARKNGKASRKRKRESEIIEPGPQTPTPEDEAEGDTHLQIDEYTAVVTPTERLHRRLAGWPVHREPPPIPFPHAPATQSNDGRTYEQKKEDPYRANDDNRRSQARPSLHSHHIATMMALLHRCMLEKDYTRAARALGLLLRNEVNGQPLDIRKRCLWQIGGEILLRRNANSNADAVETYNHVNKNLMEGFASAKLYYERLIIQYPPNKSWVDVTNALDFSTALFGLWIYVVKQETLRSSNYTEAQTRIDMSFEEDATGKRKMRDWELEQAKQIAEAMDIRMRDTSFHDYHELIRLRAMVALWVADLFEIRSRSSKEGSVTGSQLAFRGENIVNIPDQAGYLAFNQNGDQELQSHLHEIEFNRDLAQRLFETTNGE